MTLSTIITPDDVLLGLGVPTKSALIEVLAAHAAARLDADEAAIRAALLAREDLGSTGIGGQIAIPHATLEGLARPFGTLVVLRKAIEFDAVDAQPVDIVFLLLMPQDMSGDHLKILSEVARRTRDDGVPALLRQAQNPQTAYGVLVVDEPPCTELVIRPLGSDH